eukprot:1160578-Pelagomonas_calceolata.AAC.9
MSLCSGKPNLPELVLLLLSQVIMSHNIDFQVPMKRACTNEIQMFCPNVPHGDARVIRCLQDNKYAKDFGKECKEEEHPGHAQLRSYNEDADKGNALAGYSS